MSKVCALCGRGPQIKISRSHSMIATRKRQYLNLQTKTINGKRVKICGRCIKTLKKNKIIDKKSELLDEARTIFERRAAP